MRSALLGGLLVAACSSPAPKPAVPAPVATPEVTPAAHAPPAPAKPDPTLAAREAFENPGGMWLPRQLALPDQVQTLKSLGVEMESLSDPLADPLGAVVSLGVSTGTFV